MATIGNTTPSKNLVGTTPTTRIENGRTVANTTGSSGTSSPVGGAVTASGQIVGKGGAVVGQAPASDIAGSSPVAPTAPVSPVAPVNTSQPSPNSVNAIPYTNPLEQSSGMSSEQVQKNLQTSGYTPPQEVTNTTADNYRKTAEALKNTPVPNSAGLAKDTMGTALKTNSTPQDSPILGGVMETDTSFDKIFTQYDDYFNTQNQKTSLVDEYNKLSSSLGIQGINSELINEKKIIDGTEDDIRNEVTASGGFATDSQVQALSSARNKTLVKNYNTLLETRDNAMTQLSTMMNLTVQDRQMASAEFDRKMNFAFKVQEFQQKAVDNSRTNLNNIVSQVGYAGLHSMTQGNPYYTSLVEKTLGLSTGGLAQLATVPDTKNNVVTKLDNGDTVILDKSTGNIVKNVGGAVTDMGGVPEKVLTKIQSSPENKTINGILPAVQALKAYSDAINKYGTGEIFSGEGKGALNGTYGNALSAWKTLAGLGALSGADFSLAENAVPAPTFFARQSTQQGKLDSSLDNAINQASLLVKRLQQNYPQAKDLLEKQLDDVKVVAHPEKYKVGSDGLVYEITN